MISSVTGTNTAKGAATASNVKATTEPNDRMGKDAFLKLLVAQLKFQNPLSPMDGTQFIAQTAQLTMTEKLEELTTLQTAAVIESNKRSAAELVGRTITYDNGTSIVEGKVTGALMNGGAPVLLIGKTEVPLGAVLEVRSPSTSSSTPTSTTATDATSTPTTTTTPTTTATTATSTPTATTAASSNATTSTTTPATSGTSGTSSTPASTSGTGTTAA